MKSATRWAWSVALVVFIGCALVLAFVLSFGGDGQASGFYERNFVWLFWVNVAVAALLVLVIGLALVRLAVRMRRGKFGTRLLIKLAGIFALDSSTIALLTLSCWICTRAPTSCRRWLASATSATRAARLLGA